MKKILVLICLVFVLCSCSKININGKKTYEYNDYTFTINYNDNTIYCDKMINELNLAQGENSFEIVGDCIVVNKRYVFYIGDDKIVNLNNGKVANLK